MRKAGFLPASREHAAAALKAGAATIVFPGGDYDAFRPTSVRNKIDFAGRKGYVRTAIEAGVPIVPDRQHRRPGEPAAPEPRRVDRQPLQDAGAAALEVRTGDLRLPVRPQHRRPRSTSRCPPRSTTRVLEPIDIEAEFGPDPDIDEVDREVRERMQEALDELAAARRFPVLG